MKPATCPECHGPLESRAVTPCLCCGGESEGTEHHLTGLHGYGEYEVFDGLRAVLCSFCALDFVRQDPTAFGLPRERELEPTDLRLRARLERPGFEEDLYCPRCEKRLAWLRFLEAARRQHASSG